MRFLTFLLSTVGLLATMLIVASTASAADCITSPLLIGPCPGQAETEEPPVESMPASSLITPEAPDDTLFGRRWYGRLADNTMVYPSPTRAAAPLRSVGDGYLFATLLRRLQNDAAETWYEINPGEFVHEDDIQLAQVSDFQGVATAGHPQRPFGWVVQEVTPGSSPDADPDPAFDKLPRFTVVEIFDAVEGQDEWIWYDIGDGRWVKQTYLSIVTLDPRPDKVGEDDFWVEVDLYEQTFAAYEGDRLVYATLISSGLNRWPTNEGLFQVWDRFREYKMSGAEGKVDYYFLEDVPYIMYFDDHNGIALHGTFWHDRFGYKHSHGCVNMPIKDAEWTFNWSAEAPNDLWVWVHTSDPASHLN